MNIFKNIKNIINRKIRYIKINDDEPAKPRDKKRRERVMRNIGHALTVVGTTISAMLLIMVIMCCIVVTVITVYVLDFADAGFDLNLRDAETNNTSFIYAMDKEGQEVEVKRLVGEYNRVWVDYEDISPYIMDAVIATEDKRFITHNGVDWRRTVYALAMDVVYSGDDSRQGGSTLTQQLIKNLTGDDEQTWERKLREIFRALEIEKKYTKEQIIESYLNNIWWGKTYYGVGAACEYYFGKEPKDIDIAEAAILAGMIRNPGTRSPYVDLENCKVCQEYALDNMYEQGYISTQEYLDAYSEQVQFARTVWGDSFGYIDPRSVASDEEEEEEVEEEEEEEDTYEAYRWNEYEVTQNWYVDAAISQVIADYAELKGISITSARKEIYNGGYKIYINEDMEMQEKLEEAYNDPMLVVTYYDKDAPAEELVQSAFVVIDYSGTVRAIAGGLGDKPGENCFNRATDAVRAPGSTMKPISTYSMGVQNNYITYSTMLPDTPISIIQNNIIDSWPDNYMFEGGDGTLIPIWRAVRLSRNTIAVRVAQMLTPQVCYNQLTQNLGLTTLTESDIAYSPIALGALTNGVHIVELAAAYQIFGNGGIYYRPMFYSRVVDRKNNVILEQDFFGSQAIDSDTAWVTNRMLRTVVNNPGSSASTASLPNTEVIGKTGTSNDNKNLLFVGCTPEYVGAYWVGYDNGKSFGSVYYLNYSATVWHNVMINLVDTSEVKNFTPDPTVLELKYCLETGLLASDNCTETDIGYYRKENIPSVCSGNHEEEIQKIRDHWSEVDSENLKNLQAQLN